MIASCFQGHEPWIIQLRWLMAQTQLWNLSCLKSPQRSS